MYEAIIIGGSFAGQAAATMLGRAGKKTLLVDAGAPRNRTSPAAHGFLGHDGRPPGDILADARAQLGAYPAVTQRTARATRARAAGEHFVLTLDDGSEQEGARLLLATGLRDTLPDLPGLRERWGSTVLHCPYCHGFEFMNRPLGVLATSPLSVHQGLMIPDWGPTTYFTQGHWAPTDEERAQLDARGTKVEERKVTGLSGHGTDLDAVRLDDGTAVPTAALFVAPDVSLASDLAEQLGCAIESGPMGPRIVVDKMQGTTVPGVFAAGDAAVMMSNATLAAASGVMAGAALHRSLMFGLEA